MQTEERNELVGKLRNLAILKSMHQSQSTRLEQLELVYENNIEQDWYESFIDDYRNYEEISSPALIKTGKKFEEIKSELRYLSLQEPKPKTRNKPHISIWFNVIFIIFAIFDLIFFSVAYSVGNQMATNYQQVSLQNQPTLAIISEIENVNMDNPITEYDKWAALWRVDNMTWEELCNNWEPVQNNWKDLGIDIDLDLLERTINKVFGNPKTYDKFASEFIIRIRSTYYKSPGENGHTQFVLGHVFLGLFLLNVAILALYYLIKWLSVASYNKAVKNYNKKQLAIDIENHNEEKEKLQKEYENILCKVPPLIKESIKECRNEYTGLKDNLVLLEEKINSPQYDFFNIRDYDKNKLNCLADLLESGRADSFKEALNIYTAEEIEAEHNRKLRQIELERLENERAENERQAKLDRLRIAEQQRHNRELEESSAEQARQARRQALEMEKQTRIMKQQERDNKNKIDYTKCFSCARNKTCGRKTCNYLPKR